jgi:hypothetical protein
MNYRSTSEESRRRATVEAVTHRFVIGQKVRMKGGSSYTSANSGDIYQITAMLPAAGGSPQYRIRNEEERHERVCTQDMLESAGKRSSDDSAGILERTFGHG